MSQSPSFQYYPNDYLGDLRVKRLSYEEKGVYWELLSIIWSGTETQFSIENDPKMLAKILNISEKKFKKIFEKIQWPNDPIFIEQDGFLISKRLRKEKEKQVELSGKRQEAAKKRYQKPDAIAGANAGAIAVQMDCLTSSTSTSLPPISPTGKNASGGNGKGNQEIFKRMNFLLKIIKGQARHEHLSAYAHVGESFEEMKTRATREYEGLKRKQEK